MVCLTHFLCSCKQETKQTQITGQSSKFSEQPRPQHAHFQVWQMLITVRTYNTNYVLGPFSESPLSAQVLVLYWSLTKNSINFSQIPTQTP